MLRCSCAIIAPVCHAATASAPLVRVWNTASAGVAIAAGLDTAPLCSTDDSHAAACQQVA